MHTYITNNLLWSQAPGLVVVLLLSFIAALYWYRPLLILVVPMMLFSIYFFRNPERVCLPALHDPSIIVSPADGKIVAITPCFNEGYAYKISIFLSPFDVHVNRMPVSGVVESVLYRSGTFSFAFLPKSSTANERNDVCVRAAYNNQTLIIRQIAGTIARRICCWVKAYDGVAVGQIFGMIRFGSRVDLLLPENVHITVGVGQRVYAGETVVALFTS
jgi:phosphatidylserine decarboxylase